MEAPDESQFPRRAGVLLPLASLPGPHGIGDLGPEAHRFVAWCAGAGLGWWQMLPVGPVGPGNSPYSSPSAFAGEPLLLSLDRLVGDGLLARADVAAPRQMRSGRVRYAAARAFKAPRLARAYEAWKRERRPRGDFDAFCADEAHWLDAWCARSQRDEGEARFLQFQFDRQWRALRRAARDVDLRFLGDVPIFVDRGSVDVAERPELFRLDEEGAPAVVTGCPPDGLGPDGQVWGHPHYDWPAHEADDFAWWRARMRRQFELFDAVRIDHFIGFHHAWEVPAGDRHAQNGRWGAAPGDALLAAIREELGGLPLVAEDLGDANEDVLALRDRFGLPGMRVLQWAFGDGSPHAPHRVPRNAVVYPGTHDNDTVAGWARGLDPTTRRRLRAHTGGGRATVAWDLWRTACATPAHTAVAQAQDLLGLGRAARTNRPGTPSGNWTWRLQRRDLSAGLARRCRELVEATERTPRPRTEDAGSVGARATGRRTNDGTRQHASDTPTPSPEPRP